MERVALYCRVSTEEQALHGDSIQTQKEALTDYAEKHNMKIIDYYIDNGFTATSLKRPDLNRLLDDIRESKIDRILFTKIDRWSRGVRNYYKIQDILDRYKVEWKTIFENYDTSTASGRLHINIMLSVAENEASVTSERIKAVFKNKIKNKEVVSGKVPIGYKIENKKLVIDNDTANIVKIIYDQFELTHSKNATLKYVINSLGLHYSYKTIDRILKESKYTGIYNDVIDYCPVIIPKDRFDNIQKLLKNNVRTTSQNHIYIFTGLIVCSHCKHKLSGFNTIHNKIYFYNYRCRYNYERKLCSNNHCISEKKIEKWLLKNIKSELEKYMLSFKAEAKEKKKTPKIDKISIEKKINKLNDLYINDFISLDEYKLKREKYEDQLNIREIKQEEIDTSVYNEILNSDFTTIYNAFSREEKRTFWRNILKKIEININKDMQIFF